MVKHEHDGHVDDGAIMKTFNYKQELNRTLKFFGSFATAFSAISITTGIFLNYGFVLNTAGTAGIWTWPIVTIGQLLIALVFAEISGVMPISGYSYQWVKRLSNPGMGWFAGWISFCFLFIVTPSIDAAVAPVLADLLGLEATALNLMLIVMVTLTLQTAIAIISMKLSAIINNAAVYTETFGIIGLTIALIIIALVNGAPASNLVDTNNTAAAHGGSYLLPFAMASLIGLYTLVGFEVPANLSEETKDAHKTVPKAVILSVVVSGVFGTLFLIALSLGIKDMGATVGAASPILLILESNLGVVISKIFMVVIVISIFACGLVCFTSATRLVYAMSRDNAFFVSKLFKKVHPKTQTPIPASLLMWVLGLLSIYFASSITILAVAAAVLPAIYYLITVVSYALVRKKVKFREGGFNGQMGSRRHHPCYYLADLRYLYSYHTGRIP
jgi:amino acid transporter